jgi:uncharacterized membrane protein
VSIPWVGFPSLLESAFEQIRMYAKGDVAVSLRLLRALGDVAATAADPKLRQPLADLGKRIVSGCGERLNEDELSKLRTRSADLEIRIPSSTDTR